MLAPVSRPAPEPEPDPIAQLIERGELGAAIAVCARSHGPALGRLCMALLGSQADAEEAVQETLLIAHGQLPSYRGDGSIRAWLFTIARRQCARRHERGQRERRHLAAVGEAVAAPLQDQAMATARRASVVRAALAALKPSEREALVLRYQGDLSFRDIAALCGVDEAAARKRASRGMARLRTLLAPESVE